MVADVDLSLLMKKHKLLGLIKTRNEFDGRYWKLPIQINPPAGRSYNIASAIAQDYGSKFKNFDVTPVTDFQIVNLDGIVIRGANSAHAVNQVIDTVKNEMQMGIRNLVNNIARSAYSAGAARGQVHPTTAISGTTLTLATPAQARFFYPGMRIQGSATATGGSLLNSGSYVTIVSKNEDNGTLVADANWSTITGLSANHYLFQHGDYGLGPAGLGAWCTSSAPTATPFFGCDRTAAPNELAGIRFDTSGESVETFLISMTKRAEVAGFEPDVVLMHPYDVARLEKAKEGSRTDIVSGQYSIGFKGFDAYGTKILSDADCPQGTFYALELDAFEWLRIGEPGAFDLDGEYARAVAADSYEWRAGCDFNFGSTNPGKIITGAVPTT